MTKELLADALRHYSTFGHAYLAERERANRLGAAVTVLWGSLLAYYTDPPEEEVQRLIALCESVNHLIGTSNPAREPEA